MPTDNKINVLIVEDDVIIAQDIAQILKKSNYQIIGIAYNSTKAYDLLANKKIDFAILDIHIGTGDNGIDIAAQINNKYHFPYIFLTSFSDETTLIEAQEHSPYGYLVKPFQEATLLTTIAVALNNFKNQQKTLDFEKFNVEITSKEQKICEQLSKGKSYQQVAAIMSISINTVRYHVKNIYQKFNVNGRAELVALFVN